MQVHVPNSPVPGQDGKKSVALQGAGAASSLTYAFAVPGTETDSRTAAFRNPRWRDGYCMRWDQAVGTTWEAFRSTVSKHGNKPAHGRRPGPGQPFVWTTYGELMARITDVSAGLRHLNLLKKDAEGRFELMGIMGGNMSEWFIGEYGAIGQGATIVPLYTSTPTDTLAYLLGLLGLATVMCDADCAKALVKAKASTANGGGVALDTLVVFGPTALPEDVRADAEKRGLRVLTLQDVAAAGKANPIPFREPKPSDVFTFCFTSGSTGMPKGVLITHEMVICAVANARDMVDNSGIPNWHFGKHTEFHISYLPIAHVMERMNLMLLHSVAGQVGFFQGKRELLMDDVATLRPTVFASVPRLLNMIVDKVKHKVNSGGGVKAWLFNRAMRAKMTGLHRGNMNATPMYDKLIFNKLRRSMGFDRCHVVTTGSAPISGANLDFLRALLGVYISEGYGATEMTFAVSMTSPMFFSSEHVGGPLATSEICLQSIPEMNYLTTDRVHNGQPVLGRGELLVRGPAIFNEYYRNPEATAKALDREGWYHSNDVAVLLPNGTFKIVDRRSNTLKLSIGEYVSVERVENIVVRTPLVAQAFCYADSFHPHVVAVLVPDPDVARDWAKANGLSPDSTMPGLCSNPKFLKAVQDSMTATCKENSLASFEIPKVVFCDPTPFSVDNGVLTPSFKISRGNAKKLYEKKLEEMLGPVA